MGIYFTATKIYSFDACHSLPVSFEGKCQKLHGHGFKAEVTIGRESPDGDGVVIDFNELDLYVNPAIGLYDHSNLNDFIGNPTAENIAVEFYKMIDNLLGNGLWIERIRIWETDKCYAEIIKER